MARYIHTREAWPRFRWDEALIASKLVKLRHRQGRFVGRMEALGFRPRADAHLAALTEEAIKTSEIEGEKLNRPQVRSSIARKLGMDLGALTLADRAVDGLVDMLLDATGNYGTPLTEGRLLDWHGALFPGGRSGLRSIKTGAWRDDAKGPMQVVSGPIGRERVHFEAPSAKRVGREMKAFLDWFNRDDGMDFVLKGGVAHFWFVTIHPFDDGNGRIARAIDDMMLARSEGSGERFYSLSAQIRAERQAYYDVLEAASKGDLDITAWNEWRLDCLGRAFDRAEASLDGVLRKARFWDARHDQPFNDRQRKMINRLFDGFEGKLTSSKWAKLAKCSQDSALRDIADLVARGILAKDAAGGRSTSYALT